MNEHEGVYETMEYREGKEGIGILSLDRPQKYNVIILKVVEELEHFWAL